MKSARRRAREFALQALYQWQLAGQSLDDIETQYAAADGFEKADANLFSLLVSGVIRNHESLQEKLVPVLDRAWNEVSPIERAVLLIAAHELSAMADTPYRVIINEAIELAKSFGGTDGHKYVNGVLDKLAAQMRTDEIAFQAEHPVKAAKPRAVKKTPTVVLKARRVAKPPPTVTTKAATKATNKSRD
jgi:N utilization substance protein B